MRGCLRYGCYRARSSFSFSMSLLDYIIIALLAIWVIVAVIYIVRCKKKGKCIGCDESCNNDCKNCKKNKRL